MGKQIVVTFYPDGTSQIDAVGFKGASCEAATKAIEAALGQVTERKRKLDYYAKDLKERLRETQGG